MTVCFMYPSWTEEETLEMYRKMTPGCSGVWEDMVAITNRHEADYCVVIDYTHERVDDSKTIYVSAHPMMAGYTGYKDQSNKPLKLDAKDTFGFGEWWLKYDYDYLSALEPPEKTKDLCCIMSDTDGDFGRTRRKQFIKEYKYPLNLYGRIKGSKGILGSREPYGGNHTHGKEDVLREHKYSVEIDVGITRNYFSERVFDSLLMWCLPFYWGSDNLGDYLPDNSFRYCDIYGDGKEIEDMVNRDIRKDCLEDIAVARQLLLNKYQIFPRIYEFISNNPLH